MHKLDFNVVYFELLRRGYDVAIGKVDQAEVDFIATKAEMGLLQNAAAQRTEKSEKRKEVVFSYEND